LYAARLTTRPGATVKLLLAAAALPAALFFHGSFAFAAAPSGRPASIALIIDDLGNRLFQDSQAVGLPGPVGCAFLPYAPFTRTLAQQAHATGKEVLVHLPMQALGESHPEAGELTLDMTEPQFQRMLQADLAVVPYASGVNNHKGSLLTRHPGDMAWLMRELRRRGLFFVDSRTTAATVARRLAMENRVPSTDRRVFLDNVQSVTAVRQQFMRLVAIARREGTALAIGHPHTETMTVLRQELARLDDYNVRLVPVSRLIASENRSPKSWQASLSR
jgi:polysaccharide deacetylase 2 family uncharacterized protein YibQ